MTVRRILIFFLCAGILFVCHTVVLGQPPCPTCPPGDPPNPDVPITGLEYLLGGGILYGIRSLLKARKKQGD